MLAPVLLVGGIAPQAMADDKPAAAATSKAEAKAAAARAAKADKWVKKEIATARKAAGIYRKVKDSRSAASAAKQLQKLLAPYEAFYGASASTGAPARLNLPAGVPLPDLSRLQPAAGKDKLPDGLTRADIQAAQKRASAARAKAAAQVTAAHKRLDGALRNSFSTCGGNAPTSDMDTSYLDSAVGFITRYMCSH